MKMKIFEMHKSVFNCIIKVYLLFKPIITLFKDLRCALCFRTDTALETEGAVQLKLIQTRKQRQNASFILLVSQPTGSSDPSGHSLVPLQKTLTSGIHNPI